MDPVKPALLVLNSCSSSEEEAQPPLKEESPVKWPEKAQKKNHVIMTKMGKNQIMDKMDYWYKSFIFTSLYPEL